MDRSRTRWMAWAGLSLLACGPPLTEGREGFGAAAGDEIGSEDTLSGADTESTESESTESDSTESDSTESESTESESTESDSTESDSDTGEPCTVDVDLGSAASLEWFDAIEATPSQLTLSCGGFGSEKTFSWTAPAAGDYRVQTFGAAHDVVLGLLADCEGPELACNEDLGPWTVDAQLIRSFAAGESVVIVVDSVFPGATGEFGLRVSESQCPEQALDGPLPIVVSGSTVGASDELGSQSICGGSDAGEHAYAFTAPTTGTYTFDTLGSSYDTSLWIYAGLCGAEIIDCNNDFEGQSSWLAVELRAGQTVTAAVDGWFGAEGDYQLRVRQVGQEPASCPENTLPSVVPLDVVGTTVGAANEFFDACGGEIAGDRSYLYTAPAAGTYSFSTLGSAFDTTLSMRSGCGDPAPLCNDDIDWFTTDSRLVVDLGAGESVVLVVDGHAPTPGAFELHVETITCANESAPATASWTLSGSTAAGFDKVGSACGGGEAPDWVVEWTAPESGTYRVSTLGSDFDTVLHARVGGCNAPTMACNDDGLGSGSGGAGFTSLMEVQAVAGQSVLIAVDAKGSDAGTFQLRLERACDPLAPDCPADQVCGRDGDTFTCKPGVPISEGELCGGLFCGASCGLCEVGAVCVSGADHPACGQSCCDRICDLDAPDCELGEVCTPALGGVDAAPWHGDVGFCL